MGQEQGSIRQDIEQTRERMGETVDALAYKTDVKTRARESVSGRWQSMKSKVTGPVEQVTPSGDDVKKTARQAVGIAQENPLGLGVGSIALGFLVGMMLPETQMENRRLGPMADEIKDRSKEVVETALEHGKEAVQDVAEKALETGQQHAEQAKSEIQDQASQARQESGRV